MTYETCPACFQLASLHDQERFAWQIPSEMRCNPMGLMIVAYAMVLIGNPGLPLIYYGDEQVINHVSPHTTCARMQPTM